VLRGEGVTVTTGALGELMVNFGTYGWFPRQLQSDEAAGVELDSSSEELD
jgi:methylated-DNA-protein-cysteine methyltransferase related protein